MLAYADKQATRAEDGRLRLRNVDFSGIDLSGGSVKGVIFECCNLENLQARGLKIENSDFTGGSISGANLSRTEFVDASLYMVHCFSAHFDRANFQRVEFAGCNLEFASFKEAVFSDSRIGRDQMNCNSSLVGADFTGSRMTSLAFGGADFDSETRFPEDFRIGNGLLEIG